jgi:tetrahydromethanopterin S-methyltransferase subunit G
MIKLLMILSGIVCYYYGENFNKIGKTMIGIPIGLLYGLGLGHDWAGLLAMLTYFIATNAFGYGEKNIWVKWIGEQNSIILTGAMLGLAAFPVIGAWAILSMCISGTSWYVIWKRQVNEPFCAIYRAFSALILLVVG